MARFRKIGAMMVVILDLLRGMRADRGVWVWVGRGCRHNNQTDHDRTASIHARKDEHPDGRAADAVLEPVAGLAAGPEVGLQHQHDLLGREARGQLRLGLGLARAAAAGAIPGLGAERRGVSKRVETNAPHT